MRQLGEEEGTKIEIFFCQRIHDIDGLALTINPQKFSKLYTFFSPREKTSFLLMAFGG